MADHGIPDDLVAYLQDLIAPPAGIRASILFAPDVAEVDWSQYEDEEFHGAILGGHTEASLHDIWRVLKPGAHLLLIAPEDEPTGHTGACAIEDRGFEIRDAILWVRDPNRLHYVPKAPAKERHAGCQHLTFERRLTDDSPDEDEKEQWAAEGGDAKVLKGDIHPTVKPLSLMEGLLAEVPRGSTVVDPFMGSGSTAVACLAQRVNFIGVEMEEDYLTIADARIRYWHRQIAKEVDLQLESEANREQSTRKKVDDIFDI
jgi:DNA modification methylase